MTTTERVRRQPDYWLVKIDGWFVGHKTARTTSFLEARFYKTNESLTEKSLLPGEILIPVYVGPHPSYCRIIRLADGIDSKITHYDRHPDCWMARLNDGTLLGDLKDLFPCMHLTREEALEYGVPIPVFIGDKKLDLSSDPPTIVDTSQLEAVCAFVGVDPIEMEPRHVAVAVQGSGLSLERERVRKVFAEAQANQERSDGDAWLAFAARIFAKRLGIDL